MPTVYLSEEELPTVLTGLRMVQAAAAANERGSRIVQVPEHIAELLSHGLIENLWTRILHATHGPTN